MEHTQNPNNQRRVISLLVDNSNGVLARVASLFCRRGFNIDSLTVSATNDPSISRITVTLRGSEQALSQLILQTERLEVTRQVFELTGKPDKIDAFLTMFKGYEILELCRTGVTALERGGKHQHMQKPAQEVRDAQLPLPGTHCPQ